MFAHDLYHSQIEYFRNAIDLIGVYYVRTNNLGNIFRLRLTMVLFHHRAC